MNLEINKSKYEGYVWYSDRTEPEILDGQDFELRKTASENPFVLEALLFDGQNSIQVKYVDGKYLVRNLRLESLDKNLVFDPSLDREFYLPNRMNLGKRSLAFRRYWERKNDPMCEQMEILVPLPLVFVGFEKHKEDEL